MSPQLLTRINRELMFLKVAEVVAIRGTCSRAQVGAVLVRDGRIVSIGYNGAPQGMPHCEHTVEELEGRFYPEPHTSPGCQIAVHAETNALMYAARSGTPTEGAGLYSTHEPCARCAQLILTAGVRFVMFLHEYRLKEGSELLQSVGIPVIQYRSLVPVRITSDLIKPQSSAIEYLEGDLTPKIHSVTPERIRALMEFEETHRTLESHQMIEPSGLETHQFIHSWMEGQRDNADWTRCRVCGLHRDHDIHLTGEGDHVPMCQT